MKQETDAFNISKIVNEVVESRVNSIYSNFSSSVEGARNYIFTELYKICNTNNIMIWIFDENGNILSYYPFMEGIESITDKTSSDTLRHFKDESNYAKYFTDTSKTYFIDKKTYSDINTDEKDIGRSYIFVNSYGTSRIDETEITKIAICINTYRYIENNTFITDLSRFIIPVLIFLIFGMLIIIDFSRTVASPLNRFIALAKSISQGNMNVRIQSKNDKTEIGELSETVNKMMDKIEKNESQRVEFASNVAHELRTPMTSIGGFIEGILDGTIPKEKQEIYLVRVSDEIKRLTNMVKDLLVLSKMDADDNPVVKTRFDINDLIRRSIIRFETDITKRKLSVNVNFTDETTYVYANIDDIERVLINLIHNAIKFTNEGGNITITVETKKDKIYVSIRDNGIGIDKEDIANIWTRFYKGDKSRSKDKTGTGLGLSIVISVIKRHNETIDVKSQKGVGTEFTFTLENADQLQNS
ncbi:MAG: HAMP domain-containing sensor histidine kinase [Clostridia bacterium]